MRLAMVRMGPTAGEQQHSSPLASQPAGSPERHVKHRHESVLVIALVGLVVTCIAALESWHGWPWAPFPIIHAILSVIIPLWLWHSHSVVDLPGGRDRIRLLVLPFCVALLFIAGYVSLYGMVLSVVHRTADPNWNIVQTYRLLCQAYSHRYNWPTFLVAGYLLVGVWPMFGEELFYRRGIYGGLRSRWSPLSASCGAALLFGFRHAFQLVYFWPAYPIVSGLAYFIWAAGLGLLWTWAYERTGSLRLCIGVHSLNLVLTPAFYFLVMRGS